MDAPEGGPEPRRVTWRAAAVLLALAAIVPAGAFGAAKLLGDRKPATEEVVSVDSLIESAEEAMGQRRWDAPPGDNVKELTDRALEMSPGDRHVLSLRRTAADRILAEALGKKYGGSNAEALRLAKLAVALHPGLAAAEHLIKELEAPPPAASAEPPPPEPTASAVESAEPAASASAAPSASVSAAPVAGPQKGPGPRPPPAPTVNPGPGNIDDPETPNGPPEITPPGPSSARPWL